MNVNNCSLVSEEYAVFNKTTNTDCVTVNNKRYNMNVNPDVVPGMKSKLFDGVCMTFQPGESVESACVSLWKSMTTTEQFQTCLGKLKRFITDTVTVDPSAEDFIKSFPIFWESSGTLNHSQTIDLGTKTIPFWWNPRTGTPQLRVVCQDNGLLNIVQWYPKTEIYPVHDADQSTLKFYHTFSTKPIDVNKQEKIEFESPYKEFSGSVDISATTALTGDVPLNQISLTVGYNQKNSYNILYDAILNDKSDSPVVRLESNGLLNVIDTNSKTTFSTYQVFDASNQTKDDNSTTGIIKPIYAFPLKVNQKKNNKPVLNGLQWWFSAKDGRYIFVHDADNAKFSLRMNPFVLSQELISKCASLTTEQIGNLFDKFCNVNTYDDTSLKTIRSKLGDQSNYNQFKKDHPYNKATPLCACSSLQVTDDLIASYFVVGDDVSSSVKSILETEAGLYPHCLHACRNYYKDDYGAVNKIKPQNVASYNYKKICDELNCPSTIVICNAEVRATDQAQIATNAGINISQNCKADMQNILMGDRRKMCVDDNNKNKPDGTPCSVISRETGSKTTEFAGFACYNGECSPTCNTNQDASNSFCSANQRCDELDHTLSTGVCVDGRYTYDEATNTCAVNLHPEPGVKQYDSSEECVLDHPLAKVLKPTHSGEESQISNDSTSVWKLVTVIVMTALSVTFFVLWYIHS